MHRSRSDLRPGLLLAVAALLPALAAVLSGAVHVTRCVSVPGGLAQIGLNLALLRPAAECPTTGLALGGESEQVLAVVVMLTVPMLLLQVGAVAGTWGVVAAVRRALRRLALVGPWRRLPAASPLVLPARRVSAVGRLVLRARWTPGTVRLLRGPPAVLPA